MTKRTMKSALAVFEYCVKAAFLAKKEGILALEYLCLDKGITDTGEILFSRKVDKFLAWMLRVIVDGGYSLEANQSYLKKLSKYSSRKNQLLLNVASVCMDSIANGKDVKDIIVELYPHIGVDNQSPFLDLFYKLQAQDSKDFEYKFTDEQKERIKQTNVFFKMKEDECNTLLQKKNKKLCELHSRVPEFKDQSAYVWLILKPEDRNYDETMYSCSIRDPNKQRSKRSREVPFIGEIPVCDAMDTFWKSHQNCSRDIKKFMELTDDIPNNIEKYLVIRSGIELSDED